MNLLTVKEYSKKRGWSHQYTYKIIKLNRLPAELVMVDGRKHIKSEHNVKIKTSI